MYKEPEASKKYGLQINTKMAKINIIDRINSNLLHIHQVANFEVADRFVYLGFMIINNGDSSSEIKLATARTATAKLSKI